MLLAMNVRSIDCGECVMAGTDTCDDCVVTFILRREPGEALVIDAEEERALVVEGLENSELGGGEIVAGDVGRDVSRDREIGAGETQCGFLALSQVTPLVVDHGSHQVVDPGGPGSCGGLARRLPTRRSVSRRSFRRNAPQRGQRRSSRESASRGETV